jgi:phage recombination protein Bet
MTTDLTHHTPSTPMQWSDAQRDLIIQQFGLHEATDHEVAYFFEVARRTGADPLRRQIHAQMRNDKRAGRKVLTIIHGIDWYRKQAALSGDYAGSDDAVFTGTTADGNPALATVTVYKIVQGHRVAFTASARWEEYADRTYNGDDYKGLWKSKPHTMLQKVAESHALRKGWPEQLAGTYVEEELATLTTHEPLTITPEQAAIIRVLGDAAGAVGQAWEQKALTRPAEAWETTAGAAISAVEAAHTLDAAQVGQLTMLVANGTTADVQDWLDENTVQAGSVDA